MAKITNTWLSYLLQTLATLFYEVLLGGVKLILLILLLGACLIAVVLALVISAFINLKALMTESWMNFRDINLVRTLLKASVKYLSFFSMILALSEIRKELTEIITIFWTRVYTI